MFLELTVDNFAGGGGASTGIEMATGRPVDIAINHDPSAILMHKTNHPDTKHFCESVWDIDPVKVCDGHPVGLAWFSPDCKHFSKANGGKPKDKNIRGLAWVALRWAGTIRPRVIVIENVEEFVTWGPVRKGRPVKKKAGTTFMKFVSQLRALKYDVEWRELVAADYGAPTTRKRFFLIARSDGRPIVWPEPTHAPADTLEVTAGIKKPWRSAAEIIDWSLPCPSIFSSRAEIKERYGLNAQRPLRDNTLRRVIRGVDKFVVRSGKPFIVQVNHSGGDRAQDIMDPMPTVTAKHGYGVIDPILAPLHMHNHENAAGTGMDEPINTITSTGSQMLITPVLSAIGHTSGGDRSREVTEPVHTQVSKAETFLMMPSLIQYHQEKSSEYVRGQSVKEPIMTVDAANRYGLSAAHLTQYPGAADGGIDIDDPLHTVTSKDHQGLTMAHLAKFYGGIVGAPTTQPLPTVTAVDHNAIVASHVVKFKGTNLGQDAAEPLQTITAGGGEFGQVRTTIIKAEPGADFQYWPQIRDLLNQYCKYTLGDNDILLLWISGIPYFIADIGLRMLIPRELYLAQGFPPEYIIDHDYTGAVYNRTKQVARCGNAVPPPFAAALVRANLPELCGQSLRKEA